MENWIVNLTKAGVKPNVSLKIGPALNPAIIRLAIPYVIGVFIAGYGVCYLQRKMKRRRK